MKSFRLTYNGFDLHFDREFGIDKRTGWRVAIGGSFEAVLEKSLFGALRKAWRGYKRRERPASETHPA